MSNEKIHIPETAQVAYDHIHKRHMVQLFFGAVLVLIVLFVTALYIAYTRSVWPFTPLSVEPTLIEEQIVVTPPKTVEERIAEFNGSGTLVATTSDPKMIEQRRKEIPHKPIIQNSIEAEAVYEARVAEFTN